MNPRETKPSARPTTRSPTAQLDGRALAASRREAMRRRVFRIRRSVTGLALALFTAAFVGIYVQLASGHDPALTAAVKRQATTTTTSAVDTSKAEASSESTSAGTGESSQTPSAVTTSQS
jgi:hypothetical protein